MYGSGSGVGPESVEHKVNKYLKLFLAVALCTSSVGCSSTTASNAFLKDQARLAGEGHRVWTRPTEVGYEFTEGEISGSASSTSLLGVIHWGADQGNGLLGMIFGKDGQINDPVVIAAAAEAVAKSPGVDGIYITQQIESGLSVALLYSDRVVTVKGRPLKLKVIGPVPENRADKERFLRALSGGAQLHVPPEFARDIFKP